MKKIFALIITLYSCQLICPILTLAHGDITPAQVITDMKQKQKGPYAAPLFRGRRISEDWLGFSGKDLDSNTPGVIVQTIVPEKPAAEGGIKEADIITAANTTPITSLTELDNFLAGIKAPTEVKFTILRQGEQLTKDIYLVPALEEVAPEMADIMEGKSKPQPGMMRDKMMAKTPLGQTNESGKPVSPGMFAQEMMQRSPLGQQDNTVRHPSPWEQFLFDKQQEISRYKKHQKELGISDKQLETLHNIQLNYTKDEIKLDAELKTTQLDLNELLRQEDANTNKIEDVLEKLHKLNAKKNEHGLQLLRDYYSVVSKEQRLKLKQIPMFVPERGIQ